MSAFHPSRTWPLKHHCRRRHQLLVFTNPVGEGLRQGATIAEVDWPREQQAVGTQELQFFLGRLAQDLVEPEEGPELPPGETPPPE